MHHLTPPSHSTQPSSQILSIAHLSPSLSIVMKVCTGVGNYVAVTERSLCGCVDSCSGTMGVVVTTINYENVELRPVDGTVGGRQRDESGESGGSGGPLSPVALEVVNNIM